VFLRRYSDSLPIVITHPTKSKVYLSSYIYGNLGNIDIELERLALQLLVVSNPIDKRHHIGWLMGQVSGTTGYYHAHCL